MRSRYFDDDDTPRAEGGPAVTASAARPGPEAMHNDSWDEAHDHDTEHYQGRRRADTPRPTRWRLFGVNVLLMGLIAALTLATPPPAHNDAATPNTTIPGALQPTESTPSTKDEPSSSSPGSRQTSPPRGTSQSRVIPSQSRDIPAAAQKDDTLLTTPPPFPSVTFEAEAGSPTITLSGSAKVQQYPRASGGQIVTNLGNVGEGEEPGVLLISGLDIPAAGTYRIAIYFTHPEAAGTRTAVISVSGVEPVSITFAGGHNCCGVRYLEIALEQGTHTVAISNPAHVAPSIDKIVISRP
jgi:hypothetical protein